MRKVANDRVSRWSKRSPIVIGLINNMPDTALRGTERQFCALLSAASRDFLVRLKLFSLDEIERSETARAHIARYYDDLRELEEDPPDGLIITGAEPRARDLKDEPCWSGLSRLADWTRDNAISTIWSCLAAHVALLHADGIKRYPMESKLSGVFECQFSSSAHDFTNGTPSKWFVPHSRYNGVCEDELSSRGYSILSSSPATGADIFVKHDNGPSFFFQGHPEYDSAALLGEFRRDIGRFLRCELERYPDMPRGYFDGCLEAELEKFRERASANRNPELLHDFAAIVPESSLQSPWLPTAMRIYANWLSFLSEQRSRRIDQSNHFFVDAEPLRRLA